MNGADLNIGNETIDITVVVSCYNEEAFITGTLENVTAALKAVRRSYEIIVVDDASADRSVERVNEYIRNHPAEPVRLKINERNRGLANSYVEAAFLGSGKYYRLCCGDDSEPREVLISIFKRIGRADMIIPYQIQKHIAGKHPARRLASNLFTLLVNLISGYRIRYYNGSAVHRRYNVLRWHPSSYGFGFQADIITRLLDEGVSYLQVPACSVDRKGNASTALTPRNILSVGHTLLELAIRRVRRLLYESATRPVEIPLDDKDEHANS